MTILSGNDELLLLTILRLKEDAYGVTIMKLITKLTGKEWSIGAIYDPLYRLERNGIVSSRLTTPTSERGGRSKRIYIVTESGLEALKKQEMVRDTLKNDLPGIAINAG